MDERLLFYSSETFSCDCPSFFPFTQGMCTQITEAETAVLKSLNTTLGHTSIQLRLARPEDEPLLASMLYSYGSAPEDYNDLELFKEDKMPIITKNVSFCAHHRYFHTFLLLDGRQPIAFFQIDSYKLKTIADIFDTKLFVEWNPLFTDPLYLDLAKKEPEDLRKWLEGHFKEEVLREFEAKIGEIFVRKKVFNFIMLALRTYQFLTMVLKQPDQWIGNVSYNLLPQYRNCGLLTQTIECVEQLLPKTYCQALFSDRVACKNEPSRALLKRLGFQEGHPFKIYYGSLYGTRKHPLGNFSESCVGFYKKIA